MALRVLIVKIGNISDVVHTMPMLGAIHEVAPNAHISWLVGRSSADILRAHPRVQKLFVIDDKLLYQGGVMNRLGVIRDVFGQLDRGYDVVVIGHRDPGYSFALRPFIWGPFFQLSNDDTSSQVRHVVYVPPMTMHESLAMRKLLDVALKHENVKLKYAWKEDFIHIGKPLTKVPEKFVAVHFCGGPEADNEFQLKAWPRTFELVETILRETDLSIVMLGSRPERADFEKLLKKAVDLDEDRMFNLMGETSLREMVGIIRQAQMLIGPDSGPLHIADMLGVRTVGIYGPTTPIMRGLLGGQSRSVTNPVACSPCFKPETGFPPCRHEHVCMTGLQFEQVKKEVFDLLSKPDLRTNPAEISF